MSLQEIRVARLCPGCNARLAGQYPAPMSAYASPARLEVNQPEDFLAPRVQWEWLSHFLERNWRNEWRAPIDLVYSRAPLDSDRNWCNRVGQPQPGQGSIDPALLISNDGAGACQDTKVANATRTGMSQNSARAEKDLHHQNRHTSMPDEGLESQEYMMSGGLGTGDVPYSGSGSVFGTAPGFHSLPTNSINMNMHPRCRPSMSMTAGRAEAEALRLRMLNRAVADHMYPKIGVEKRVLEALRDVSVPMEDVIDWDALNADFRGDASASGQSIAVAQADSNGNLRTSTANASPDNALSNDVVAQPAAQPDFQHDDGLADLFDDTDMETGDNTASGTTSTTAPEATSTSEKTASANAAPPIDPLPWNEFDDPNFGMKFDFGDDYNEALASASFVSPADWDFDPPAAELTEKEQR